MSGADGEGVTGKIASFPVVLFGTAYWPRFQDLPKQLVVAGTIDPADLELVPVTDSVAEVISHIERYRVRRFGLLAPSRRLRERATRRLAAA
jgi:predicted Rossmann-fold nucleotide-binding protein